MVSDESAGETAETGTDSGTGDSREQGVDIGPLADELDDHSYPTTTSELVAEYGDYEVELPDGTQSFGDILDGLEGEDEEYDSADQVRQMIYNMVGSEAVGREGYSDRGGIASDGEESDAGEDEDESF
jgi:hypothetical protein